MDCKAILENFPVSVYLVECKVTENSFEFLNFHIIKNVKVIGFEDEELTFNKILGNFDKEEIKEFENLIKNKKVNDVFTFKHHLKGKNGKLFYFKNYIRILEVKNNIYTLLSVITDISNEFQLSEIFDVVYKSPIIGVVIYKDKIIFANDTFKKMFETDDKIYDLSIIDLLPEHLKESIANNLKRRLKGEKLSNQNAAEFKSFKNRRIFLEFFAETIFYNGEYAGLAFVLDKTNMYKNEKMLKILLDINDIITKIKNQNILINKIYDSFKNWNYFDEIKLNERLDLKELVFNNHLKGEYKSYLYLPIIIKNKVFASFSFYSKYEDDFDENIVSTMKQIQKKITTAINNIRLYNTLKILKKAVDKSYQWMIITDKNGKIIYANKAVEEISGYKIDEIIGKTPKIFKSNEHDEFFYKNLWDRILKGEIFNGILKNKKKNGEIFYLKDKIIPVEIGEEKYFVSLGIDVTQEKKLKKDDLTNLYNREGFLFYGQKKLKDKEFAVILLDIKDFKVINESKGYIVGDKILKEVAQILQEVFKNSIIARIANDDFSVLLEIDDMNKLFILLDNLIKKLKEKKIDVKIGIAIYPKDALSLQELIDKAYIALNYSKNANDYQFYNKNINLEINKYADIKKLVDEALENKEFIFYLQPYVSVEKLNIYGAESLLRIQKKDKIILPYEFIDFVEKNGEIKKIENLMIRKLIQIIDEIKKPISFNISTVSLKDKKHIEDFINISKDYSKFITIEITERELIEDIKLTLNILDLFKNYGYKIAIDDFGTGYSSLTYISNLPLDIIKVDISFIRNMLNNKRDLIIVETIINFAQKLNLKTIAEGVEKKEQIDILKNLGCDYLQGYYFYKPMPLEELKKLLN